MDPSYHLINAQGRSVSHATYVVSRNMQTVLAKSSPKQSRVAAAATHANMDRWLPKINCGFRGEGGCQLVTRTPHNCGIIHL